MSTAESNNSNVSEEEEKYHESQYTSIEVHVDPNAQIINQRIQMQSTPSNETIIMNEVPSYKTIPNEWRKLCKQNFEEFWVEYFDFFDDDMSHKYHKKFVELKIDDIRCIPFIDDKHLLMFVHMLSSDAINAMRSIQRFKQNKDLFFDWISDVCQCQDYVENFESAGILTWAIFAQRIVKKSDLNAIIPDNQMNNNIARDFLWKNVPSDVWNYYRIDRESTLTKRDDISTFSLRLTQKPNNLKPDVSWHYQQTPQKLMEYLWIFFIVLLFLFDIIIAILIIFTYFIDGNIPNQLDDMMPYLVNNILNPLHFIMQLLLILSWMEWIVFVATNNCRKKIQFIIILLLCITFLVLIFNVILYFLQFVIQLKHDFIEYIIDDIQENKYYRNTWFILNGVLFIIILFIISFMSIRKICKEEIKYLALRKKGENKIVKNLEMNKNECCCKCFSYLSLTIVRYVICTIIVNILMFSQSLMWLYWRYIQSPHKKHHEIRNMDEFKLIIFATDIACILCGIFLIFCLKKQRENYEEIKEINNSKRRLNTHSPMVTEDLHGFDGIHTHSHYIL